MAKKAAKKKKKAPKKAVGKLPRSFFVALIFLLGLPAGALVGWYAYTVTMEYSAGARQAEKDIKAGLSEAAKKAAELARRAAQEGFKVRYYDACDKITDQYKIPQGYVITKFTRRELVGLPKTATEEQVQERCIMFAKAVTQMEQLAHHDRHVFVCEGARFATDAGGGYYLTADPQGRGVIEHYGGATRLTEIPKGRFELLKSWQVYNVGDGCIIVGMSKQGVFQMQGGVELD